MSALRLARGFTGRDKIVKFDGCYHGHADALLVAAGLGRRHARHPRLARRARGHGGRHARRCRTTTCAAVEARLRARTAARSPPSSSSRCAGNMGVRRARGRASSRRCASSRAEHGAAADLRRGDDRASASRLGGAQALFGIRPDLTCLGKIIGGGLPVGGLRRPRRHHGPRRARWARSTRPARSRATRWPWPPGCAHARPARAARHLRARSRRLGARLEAGLARGRREAGVRA